MRQPTCEAVTPFYLYGSSILQLLHKAARKRSSHERLCTSEKGAATSTNTKTSLLRTWSTLAASRAHTHSHQHAQGIVLQASSSPCGTRSPH